MQCKQCENNYHIVLFSDWWQKQISVHVKHRRSLKKYSTEVGKICGYGEPNVY